jgi:flavin reductase (DIM6/NTAB) family NADH-FMN oxidoreductase RutF/DNA-binding IclR family transcriptional regulator
MLVGSFTSVSLDPPLVAFLPDRASVSWGQIRTSGNFCVNILGANQESVCRRFASKASQKVKFEALDCRLSPLGSPIIDGAVAWIDCVRGAVHEAGDHFIVIGNVRDLQIESGGLPLLFFQGGYGRFWPLSLAAADPLGRITDQLRDVEAARPEMDALADELRARCIATVRVDDEIIVAASAGHASRNSISTLVGQRLPFIPPTGSVFAAFYADKAMQEWLNATSEAARRDEFRLSLRMIHERGYSIGLINAAQRQFATTLERLAIERARARDIDMRDLIQNLAYDPAKLDAGTYRAVRLISVPVFSPAKEVAMALTLYEFAKPDSAADVQRYIDQALRAAARIGAQLA